MLERVVLLRHDMGTLKTDVKHGVDNMVEELERLGDQIKLKIHLASMDAKDAWNKLEPRVTGARDHAKAAGEASKETVEELLQAVRSLRASL